MAASKRQDIRTHAIDPLSPLPSPVILAGAPEQECQRRVQTGLRRGS